MEKVKLVLLGFVYSLVLCTFNAQASNKVTIAIGDIEYRAMDSSENKRYSAYGRGTREDTRAFGDMLTTALVKTRKFNVIERDKVEELLKEQGMSINGIAKGGYEGKSFNLQGVDYILTGSITEYGEVAKGTSIGGFSTSSRKASMAVDIRVLKVADGTVGIAETVRAERDGGSSLSVDGFIQGDNDSSGALLGEVMRETSTNVTNLIVSTFYPIKVIAKTGGDTIILNYGNGYLKKGDVLNVFSQGEAFTDPDTGEVLGAEEELVGKIEVSSPQTKFSKAKIISGQQFEKGMIARIVKNETTKQKKETKKLSLF
ncbi:CsgG/HfaB family protein [Pseudoalteromonas ruthenica]|uniref:CsgG/HfaB family protein n=1 Tax=Pseudoalteromonas ruthenica TaxID=151081 RepID=UPI001478D4EB|nr:CsgG/HfaB family protein [Pseudoalteromonas ruthenica]